MTAARREALQSASMPAQATNAGLELDRYLTETVGGENKALHGLIDRVCRARPPEIYGAAYRQWEATLDGWGAAVARDTLAVADRLIIGLGSGGVRETGVTLQHVYGVPLIPGTALKGLARRYARQALMEAAADAAAAELAEEQLKTLVGSPDSAAFVTFFDAWYVPGSAPDDLPLQPDVVTVHHPTYYRSRGTKGFGPLDFDDPTPIPFVREAGSYLVAVRGPDPAWAGFGLAVLIHALDEWGIGGKTSSGYGRLRKPDLTAAETMTLTEEIAALVTPTVEALREAYERCRALDPERRQAPARALMVHLSTPGHRGLLNHPWAKAAKGWAEGG
jgi:CRISPR-associated protein Cmr6